jgi:predicted DNA-binding transcriptional regulator YafY
MPDGYGPPLDARLATAQRLLRLLSLLQGGRLRPADDLAGELEITPRTVRRDVARLRELGYRVEVDLGPGGGYRLAGATGLPPLLLDTDEVVAVLVALQARIPGGPDADVARSALTKLQQALPPALRAATTALLSHATDVQLGHSQRIAPPPVDNGTLVVLARASRAGRRITAAMPSGPCTLEPQRLVRALDRWYVLAHHVEDGQWRAVPVDELRDVRLTGVHAERGALAGDARDHVASHVKEQVRRVTATVRVHAPADRVAAWVQPAWGAVTAESATTCLIDCGADTYNGMARWLLLIGADITVLTPPPLQEAFAEVAAQAGRAAAPGGPSGLARRTRSRAPSPGAANRVR